LVGPETAWIWSGQKLQPVSSGLPANYLAVFREPILLTEQEGLNFVQHELEKLRSFFEIESGAPAEKIAEPAVAEVVATFEGSLNHLSAKLQFLYGPRVVTAGVTSESMIRDESGNLRPRNIALEHECLRRLLDSGFT